MSFSIQNTTISTAVNKSVAKIDEQNTNFEIISGTSIINIDLNYSHLVNSGTDYTITLPTSNYIGQQKILIVTSNSELFSSIITISYVNGYGNNQTSSCSSVGDMIIFNSSSLGWQITFNSITTLPLVSSTSLTASFPGRLDFTGNVISQGSSDVTERGVVYNTTGDPTILDSKIIASPVGGIGSFTLNILTYGSSHLYYARAYAINTTGISYGSVLTATPFICLAKGTLISLYDGTTKFIEDIDYLDSLKVWNFDQGDFDSAKPLWIKVVQTASEYNLLEFNDGSNLKTIGQHRIFNKELGKFTYPMSDETPIGTHTFNVEGEEVTLVSKKVINEEIEYYNIITKKHINMFGNGILTSCRYNNIYPIVNMKFVKDLERKIILKEQYPKYIQELYFDDLRLSEQNIEIKDTVEYINRLEKFKK